MKGPDAKPPFELSAPSQLKLIECWRLTPEVWDAKDPGRLLRDLSVDLPADGSWQAPVTPIALKDELLSFGVWTVYLFWHLQPVLAVGYILCDLFDLRPGLGSLAWALLNVVLYYNPSVP